MTFYRRPIRVHDGTMPDGQEMFFFCLGQLTAEGRGKGFIPIYRRTNDESNIEFQMCTHGKSQAEIIATDPVPEFADPPVDFVACPRRYFSVVLRDLEYFIPVFVGECKKCSRRYVLHDVESLKDYFGD